MANQVTTYQCLNCTAPLQYDAGSGMLQCEFCGSSFSAKQIEAAMQEKEQQAAAAFQNAEEEKNAWDASALGDDWGKDAEGMKRYSCPSCGAELICDATTAASFCPYCNNPTVVPGQLSGVLKPDYVIPFGITKAEAIEKLKERCEGKFFLPRRFKQDKVLREIQGVYVPFWLFDGEGKGFATYSAERTNVEVCGDKEITDIYHYNVIREGKIAFEKVPVDASSKMDDAYMDSIEPYDYKGLKRFSTAYLPGYLADVYDKSVDECAERADRRAKETVSYALWQDASAPYDSCTVLDETIQLTRGKVHYALFPVWLLNVEWMGKRYRFAVNGQTGKIVGDLPINKLKVAASFAAVSAAVMAVGSAVISLVL